MRIVLLGAPGVGKGTQGIRIAEHYGIPQISTGDILRIALREGTRLGKKAKSFMDKGELVPDDIIIDLMRDRLCESDCRDGFILDGFPRSIPQAEALDKIFEEMNLPLDAVVNINVDEEEIVKRLNSRRICRNCGEDYNSITNPPPGSMDCTKCGGEIYQRDDDKEETIRNRLAVYKNETEPLISYFANKNLVQTVDGLHSPDNVYKSIEAILESMSA